MICLKKSLFVRVFSALLCSFSLPIFVAATASTPSTSTSQTPQQKTAQRNLDLRVALAKALFDQEHPITVRVERNTYKQLALQTLGSLIIAAVAAVSLQEIADTYLKSQNGNEKKTIFFDKRIYPWRFCFTTFLSALAVEGGLHAITNRHVGLLFNGLFGWRYRTRKENVSILHLLAQHDATLQKKELPSLSQQEIMAFESFATRVQKELKESGFILSPVLEKQAITELSFDQQLKNFNDFETMNKELYRLAGATVAGFTNQVTNLTAGQNSFAYFNLAKAICSFLSSNN